MPAIVGNIKILSVGTSSVVQFGDTLVTAPKSSSKTFAGSGSFNTGDFPVTNTAFNATATNDSDGIDDTVNTGVL